MKLSSPLEVHIELTYRCNHNCIFCYNSSSPSRKEFMKKDIIDKLLGEIIYNKVFAVSLGGGEPFLYLYLEDLINLLYESRISVLVNTNGRLLKESKLELLSKISLIMLSLHTLDEKIYQKLTGMKIDPVLASLSFLKLEGFSDKTQAVFVVTNSNIDQIARSIEELYARYDIDKISLLRPIRAGRAVDSWNKIKITRQEILDLLYKIKDMGFAKNVTLDEAFRPIFTEVPSGYQLMVSDFDRPCPINKLIFHPNGDAAPCFYSQIVLGNIMHFSLQEIWSRIFDLDLYKNFPTNMPEKCRDCPAFNLCKGGCRISALLEEGDFYGVDPFCSGES